MLQALVNDVASLPGVVGACIFDKKEGALCGMLHERVAVGMLDELGIHLVRLLQMGAVSGLRLRNVHFLFDRYAVVGLPFQADSALLAICTPCADCSAIASAAVGLTQAFQAANPAASASAPPAAAAEAGRMVPAVYPAELQAVLCRVEQALASAIGPVAGMVMLDYIDQWQQSGPATVARVVELTDMLVEEIGDPGAAQDFVAKIEKII